MFEPVPWNDTTITVTADDNIRVSTEMTIDYARLSNIAALERKIYMPTFDVKDFVVHELNSILHPIFHIANPGIEDWIKHIYANPEKGVLIVKWEDNTITKVVISDPDKWDLEAGVNAAIVKRLYKSHNAFKNFITENTTYTKPKKEKK